MRISKIELFHVSIPLKNNFYPSWIPGYPQTHNQFDIIKLTTDDGYEGYVVGLAFSTERLGLGDLLAPYLLGNDPTDLELAHRRISEGGILHWRNFWIEAAFYDLKAKIEGIPVRKMLGGSDKPIPMYWSSGEVCNPKKHSKIVKEAQDDGYHGVKLRVHSKTLEEDVQVIRNTRSLVDKDYPLAIDVNQGWPVTIVDYIPNWDLNRAQQFTEQVKDLNIAWLEEPLDMHAYEDLAALRETTDIKIAGCELNSGWHEARMMGYFGSLDIYQPDVTFSGIKDSLRILDFTKSEGLGFSPHTWTNGAGLLTNMHVYALTDRSHALEYPLEPESWTPKYRDAILKEPLIPQDGYLELPSEPGLGLDINWEMVERYGEKFFEMSEGGLSRKVIKEKGIWTAMKLKLRKSRN